MATSIEPFYAELGRRIQGFRKRAGRTQGELGSALGSRLTRASLANIENGKQRVLAHTLVEIAEALDVPVSRLLPPAPDRKPNMTLENELVEKLEISKTKARIMAAKLGGTRRAP